MKRRAHTDWGTKALNEVLFGDLGNVNVHYFFRLKLLSLYIVESNGTLLLDNVRIECFVFVLFLCFL